MSWNSQISKEFPHDQNEMKLENILIERKQVISDVQSCFEDYIQIHFLRKPNNKVASPDVSNLSF